MDRIGKYDILGELGHGGMGVVYKARDSIIGRDVAIKVIHDRALQDPSIKQRFYREAQAAGRLSHPNLTILHDVGEDEGRPYLVMEFLEGNDLRSMLKAGTPLTDLQKLSIAKQICSGLQYAHEKGVIHRDIKPENIRVLPSGTIKVMDFGIARIQSEGFTLTKTGVGIGTPPYMSPEQIEGKKIGPRSDIFSFGVLFYEMLTGINPFAGESVTTIIYKILHTEPEPLTIAPDTLCEELQAIVSTCIAKDPDERYASFAHVLEDLQALSDVPDRAKSKSKPRRSFTTSLSVKRVRRTRRLDKSKPKRSRSKGLWVTLAVLLAVGLAAGSYFVFQPDLAFLSTSEATEPEDAPAEKPGVTAMTLTPSEATVGVGDVVHFNVELRDAQGQFLGPPDLTPSTVRWITSDSTVAVVVGVFSPEEGGARGAVTARNRGRAIITASAGGVAQSALIEVALSSAVVAEAAQTYVEAKASLQDASLPDSVVLSSFEIVRDTFGYALETDEIDEIELTIQRLSTAIETFHETQERDTRDSLTIFQKRATWQTYLDEAFRESPATQFAEQRVLEIDDVVARSATLEENSLTTCDRTVPGGSTGALRICRDSAIVSQFPSATSIYFNARVNAPRSATIRWEWLDPAGAVSKQNRTRIQGVQGYRIWDVLSSSVIQKEGKYEIRIYNEEDVLIGRRPFTITNS